MKALRKRQFLTPPGLDDSYISWDVERDDGDPASNFMNLHTINIHDGRETVYFNFWKQEKSKLRKFRKLINEFCDAVEADS